MGEGKISLLAFARWLLEQNECAEMRHVVLEHIARLVHVLEVSPEQLLYRGALDYSTELRRAQYAAAGTHQLLEALEKLDEGQDPASIWVSEWVAQPLPALGTSRPPEVESEGTPLAELGLSVRAYNPLMRAGLTSIEAVVRRYLDGGDFGLLRVRVFGEKCLEETLAVLRERGLIPDENQTRWGKIGLTQAQWDTPLAELLVDEPERERTRILNAFDALFETGANEVRCGPALWELTVVSWRPGRIRQLGEATLHTLERAFTAAGYPIVKKPVEEVTARGG